MFWMRCVLIPAVAIILHLIYLCVVHDPPWDNPPWEHWCHGKRRSFWDWFPEYLTDYGGLVAGGIGLGIALYLSTF